MTTAPGTPLVRRIDPPTIHRPRGYSHVVEVLSGRPVYISGQIAMDPDGNVVGPGDLRAQAHQVFANLRAALEAVGAGFGDLAKLNTYVLDVGQAPVVREVRDQYLVDGHRPASTLVQVGGLALPDYLIEIEAVAILPES